MMKSHGYRGEFTAKEDIFAALGQELEHEEHRLATADDGNYINIHELKIIKGDI